MKKVKINLSEKIKNLKGEDAFDESAGVILANFMMDHLSSKEPVRFFNLAMKLIEDKEIEIEKDDKELLVAIIKESNLSNLIKTRMLICLVGQ